MTFIPNWEEFEKSAEMLYLRDPLNTRYCTKYSHSKGLFVVKITDNKKNLLDHQNAMARAIISQWSSVMEWLLQPDGAAQMTVNTLCPATTSMYSAVRKALKLKSGNSVVLYLSHQLHGYMCLQYKTEVQQDVRKIDKFISNLMRHMASNDD